MNDRSIAYARDFRAEPSINGLATRYAWDRSTIINDEWQFYLDPNWAPKWVPFSFDERGLAITARETPEEHAETGMPYLSGVITSNGPEPFSQRYGRWEVVATLPSARGSFVAPLWLLPMDWTALKRDHPGESVLSEIDVCEAVGEAQDGVYHVTVHTRGAGGSKLVAHSQRIETGQDLAAAPHAYALEWTHDFLVFLFDGLEVWRFPTPSDMHDVRHWICNYAVGGSWAGAPDPADYPSSMIVESITVLRPLPGEPVKPAVPGVSPDALAAAHAALERYRTDVQGSTPSARRERQRPGGVDGAVVRYAQWLAADEAEARRQGTTRPAILAAVMDLPT